MIRLLRVYPKGIKTYVHTKTFIQVFIKTLLSIARNWEQVKQPLSRKTDKRIMVHPLTRIPLGSKKEQTTDGYNQWMNLKDIMLNESSQTPKGTQTVRFHSRKDKSVITKSK